MTEQRFLSLASLAERLDCSERAVEEYISLGLLPAPIMLRGKRLYWWPDVVKAMHKMRESQDRKAELDRIRGVAERDLKKNDKS